MAPPAPAKQLPALDGIRGLAILGVLIFHSFGVATRPEDGLLHLLGRSGWVGVDLFFVLSGFLISGILLDHAGSPRYLRTFYVRRALRIFPLYYLVLALVFGLGAVVPALQTEGFERVADNQIWLWLYASNIKLAISGNMNDFGWVSGWVETTHFWSLAVEEQFYLVWPAVLLLVRNRPVWLIGTACFAVAFASRALFLYFDNPVGAYMSMPCHVDAFAAGAVGAMLIRSGQDPRDRERLLRGGALVAAAGIVSIMLVTGNYEHLDPPTVLAGYTLNAVLFGCVILLAAGAAPASRLAKTLSIAPLRSLGKYSYAMYIFQVPLLKLISLSPLWRHPVITETSGVGLFLAVSVGSYVLAWLSWFAWESRFLRFKHHFPYRSA